MNRQIIIALAFWLGAIFYSTLLFPQPAPANKSALYALKAEQAFLYNIIPATNNTWGYDILKNGKPFIHQPTKPGLPGKEGFATKADATKVARLVITKMKKGEMPPTISPEELKALKVKY